MVADEKKESYELVDKKYQLVPPDGGWGYIVAMATIIIFCTTTMFIGSFGMLYNDFFNEVEMSSAGVTLLSGIYSMSIATAGFFTSPLLTLTSTRKLAFAAAAAFSCGIFGTVIMTTQSMFFLCAGVLQGGGLGILFNLTCTIMNDYFVEKRLLSMSCVQTVTGVSTMVSPMLVKWMLEEYGSRGTLLLIGGISLHNFFAVLLMQPVKWHMKKVEIEIEKAELKLLLEEKDGKKVTTPVIMLTDLEENTTKEKNLEFPENDAHKSSLRKAIDTLLDTSLFKTFLFSCASFGPAMCASADSLYLMIIPQYLYSMDWSQENVAMTIAMYGFGDLAMRVVLTFVSKWMFKMGIKSIYIAGIVLAFISRLGLLWSSSLTSIMVFFTLVGVAHCIIAVLLPLVIAEAVPPEKFTSAMGICLLLSGILGIGLGPAVGAVRDITNSYSAAFYTLTSFYAVIAVLWPIELIVKSNIQRKKKNKINSKSSQTNKVPE